MFIVDVINICCKKAKKMWEKRMLDPVIEQMWMIENLAHVFFYQIRTLMNLNSMSQEGLPFTFGIQMEWQLEMMVRFGHNNVLSIDATFDTNQTHVSFPIN